jgi:integrase
VLTLAFGGLRFGEATALRRCDVRTDDSMITVERSVRHLDGRWVIGPPKTDAGRRTVALPASSLPPLQTTHVGDGDDELVFGARSGRFVARSNFSLTFHRAVQACDLPPVRVHELRHTGATLAAATGASTAELMRRFGHSSPAAALVYQHPAVDRDQEIARMLNALASGGDVVPIGHRLNRPADPSSGTKRHG